MEESFKVTPDVPKRDSFHKKDCLVLLRKDDLFSTRMSTGQGVLPERTSMTKMFLPQNE